MKVLIKIRINQTTKRKKSVVSINSSVIVCLNLSVSDKMLVEYMDKIPLSYTSQALVLAAIVGYVTYKLLKKKHKLPPGPRGLPLVGSLLTIMGSKIPMYKFMFNLKKEYGQIVTVQLGPVKMIVLNGPDVVKETLIKKGRDTSGRMKTHSIRVLSDNFKSIVASDATPTWKIQRKLALQGMRQYLSGKNLEEKLFESTTKVIQLMKQKVGEPTDITKYMSLVVFNMLHGVCFSKRFDLEDELFIKLLNNLDKFGEEISTGVLEDIVPLLKYWPTKRFQRIIHYHHSNVNFIRSEFEAHKENFSEGNLKDVTDFLIHARNQEALEDPTIKTLITDEHLVHTISDVFGAGVDTSRQSLTWTIYLLVENPRVQKAAQDEIDNVLSVDQQPTLRDRERLPYTEAVLHESLRMHSPAPMGVPHCTTADITIGGYDIPKGSTLFTNFWALQMDPEVWGDPEVFRPERFLDEDGKLAPKNASWMPFSAGRRNCLGETIARPELHLILTLLLRNFSFSKGEHPEGKPWSIDPASEGGFLSKPPSNFIVVTSRS
ncbi:hypothetical protein LOTGIDRAFT_231412 [Lottia gigantea]|uniref:Uncharacterized protein n=1 Tax=Lottia gigantea TaxID=225164 RepID=V4A3E5_LOTGI|nr:hypothetical protein LOTGIDRAFT_231412 [Lottia gigantea]ESO98348.1 hypothetical protein LOTGIDRAFT_231412 [Lottia gigantea]